MSRRRLSAEELKLWRLVTADLTPLPGKAAPPPAQPSPTIASPIERPPPQRAPQTAKSPPAKPEPFDNALRRKIARGHLPIEARLDLHGHRQDDAMRLLIDFITQARHRGARVVQVITGKGAAPQGGVLKRLVPLWLEQPVLRAHVVAVTPSDPRHGGSGALLVHLRKIKE